MESNWKPDGKASSKLQTEAFLLWFRLWLRHEHRSTDRDDSGSMLEQIAARPRSTLTPVSNHGFTDPLAAESFENMNKKLGFESVGFLTDGF